MFKRQENFTEFTHEGAYETLKFKNENTKWDITSAMCTYVCTYIMYNSGSPYESVYAKKR